MKTKYDELAELAKEAEAGDWPEQSDFQRDASPAVVRGLIAELSAAAESLEPFVLHNSSEETILITVRTADVMKARAALKRIQGEGK